VLFVHGWIRAWIFKDPVRLSITPLLWSAIYTAIVAVPVLATLHRIRRNFGFQPARRRI